jgi:hypothetical protein
MPDAFQSLGEETADTFLVVRDEESSWTSIGAVAGGARAV